MRFRGQQNSKDETISNVRTQATVSHEPRGVALSRSSHLSGSINPRSISRRSTYIFDVVDTDEQSILPAHRKICLAQGRRTGTLSKMALPDCRIWRSNYSFLDARAELSLDKVVDIAGKDSLDSKMPIFW
jgi:hypothetical protein